jgi:hypothetical protein
LAQSNQCAFKVKRCLFWAKGLGWKRNLLASHDGRRLKISGKYDRHDLATVAHRLLQ